MTQTQPLIDSSTPQPERSAKGLPYPKGEHRNYGPYKILPSDSRDERIAKGKQIVARIANKLIARGQEPYLERGDIESSGYAAMIRAIDAPESDLAVEKRIAANCRRAMLRDFIRMEMRERSFSQAARADRPREPRAKGVVCPEGDPDGNPPSPLQTRDEVLLSRSKGNVDHDSPSARNREAWRDAFVHSGWTNIEGRRQKRFVSRAEIQHRAWERWRVRFWSDIRTAVFDHEECCLVLGPKPRLDTFNQRRDRCDALTTAEFAHNSETNGFEFQQWVYGWSSTVTDRRTRWAHHTDLLTARGKFTRVPDYVRQFAQTVLLECGAELRKPRW